MHPLWVIDWTHDMEVSLLTTKTSIINDGPENEVSWRSRYIKRISGVQRWILNNKIILSLGGRSLNVVFKAETLDYLSANFDELSLTGAEIFTLEICLENRTKFLGVRCCVARVLSRNLIVFAQNRCSKTCPSISATQPQKVCRGGPTKYCRSIMADLFVAVWQISI